MNVLTAVALGSFEVRICAQSQILSPLQQEELDQKLIMLMNQFGEIWKRYFIQEITGQFNKIF